MLTVYGGPAMPNPWDTLDLIQNNLLLLSNLQRNTKLGQPDAQGHFKIDRQRNDADSITQIEPLLKKFLKRAALVALCEEHPQTGLSDGFLGLFNKVTSTGLPTLRSTYQAQFLSAIRKTNQRSAVDRLLQFAQNEPRNLRSWLKQHAEDAFRQVRLKYKGGEKSSNKRYEDKPGGKYSGGMGPNKPLIARNQQVNAAALLISKNRSLRDEESRAELPSAEVKQNRDDTAAQLDAFSIPSQGVPFASLDANGRQLLKASIAGMSGVDKETFQYWYGEWSKWSNARNIQKNRSYVPHNPENAKAGNCMELAELVYLHLKRNHVPFVSQVGLSRMPGQLVDNVHEGDHAFAIVGLHLVGKGHGFKRGQDRATLTPNERRTMHDAWVIDPWINEFCTVADYRFRFQQKMADWSKKGKQISVNGAWIDPDPTTKDWYWRTVAELDWEIYEYHHYDNQVFNAEE